MMTVYLETTVPSYLVARPSRDLIVAAHQQITREWWDIARHRYDLVISQIVLKELARGDSIAAGKRLEAVRGIRVLEITDAVDSLVQTYIDSLLLPPSAEADVLH